MTRARRELVSLDDTPYYHCTTRCVRRAFLCGKDHQSGECFEHRRAWIVRRMKELAGIFAIDIAAYAVMSNHYHIVLRVNAEASESWSRDEVIRRWRQLFKGPPMVQRYCVGASLSAIELEVVDSCVAQWRQRLADISWFMRCLNEHIARKANVEDRCKGRFWEGRFTSQALLDETALLACMAYVDLNPIRACMADRPESSDYTSIQERLGIDSGEKETAEETETQAGKSKKATPRAPLMAFSGALTQDTPPNTLPYNLADYIELVDWTGRAVRGDKRGAIKADLPPLLQRLNVDPEQWLNATSGIEQRFYRAIGPVASLQQWCAALKKRWLHGTTACRALYRRPAPAS